MKIITGKVVSTKMKDTITVVVDNMKVHRLYGKRYVRSKKYHVHDDFSANVGDTVNFTASRPYSRIVKWKTIKSGSNKLGGNEDKGGVKVVQKTKISAGKTVEKNTLNKEKGKQT